MQASIYPITPFDATKGGTITFKWTGNQATANRCLIKNNKTQDIIYNQTIDTFKLEHFVDPTKTENGQQFVNGEQYVAYIYVTYKESDENYVESEESNLERFYCFADPEFGFTNIENGQVLDTTTYEFLFEYNQADGELLNSWQMIVYDQNNSKLSDSKVQYNAKVLAYTFSGFSNANNYKIRLIGQTVNGIKLDTGYIDFSVSYDLTTLFSMIDCTNLPKQGAILIHSNIISADGIPEKEPVVYVGGDYVDLTDNSVTYNEGFLFDGDFSFVIYGYQISPNKTLVSFSSAENPNFSATLTYRVGYVNSDEYKGYVEFRATSNGVYYYTVLSNYLTALGEEEILGVCLVRKDGLYDIQIANLTAMIVEEEA